MSASNLSLGEQNITVQMTDQCRSQLTSFVMSRQRQCVGERLGRSATVAGSIHHRNDTNVYFNGGTNHGHLDRAPYRCPWTNGRAAGGTLLMRRQAYTDNAWRPRIRYPTGRLLISANSYGMCSRLAAECPACSINSSGQRAPQCYEIRTAEFAKYLK